MIKIHSSFYRNVPTDSLGTDRGSSGISWASYGNQWRRGLLLHLIILWHTPIHSVGLHWTRDRGAAETST